MTPEQFAEALGRGMMQAILGQQPVAPKRSRSSTRARSGPSRGASARATPEATLTPPIQSSMFEPPNAEPPSPEELDRLLGITRIQTQDPPGTYRPDEVDMAQKAGYG